MDYKSFQESLRKKSVFIIKTVRVNISQKYPDNHYYDKGQDLYHFRIRIFLETTDKSTDCFSLDDIAVVKYKLHPTYPDPIRASDDRRNNFEIKIWTYGFFETIATVFLRNGKTIEIQGKVDFPVTNEEIDKNGKDELTWS